MLRGVLKDTAAVTNIPAAVPHWPCPGVTLQETTSLWSELPPVT